MADARDLKSLDGNILRVRVPPRAPHYSISPKTPDAPIPYATTTPHTISYEKDILDATPPPPHDSTPPHDCRDSHNTIPTEDHALAKVFCKFCRQSASSISSLTANKCPNHPDGHYAGRHAPAQGAGKTFSEKLFTTTFGTLPQNRTKPNIQNLRFLEFKNLIEEFVIK